MDAPRAGREWDPFWDYCPKDLEYLLFLGLGAVALPFAPFRLPAAARGALAGLGFIFAALFALLTLAYFGYHIRITRRHPVETRWLAVAWSRQRGMLVAIVVLWLVNLALCAVAGLPYVLALGR